MASHTEDQASRAEVYRTVDFGSWRNGTRVMNSFLTSSGINACSSRYTSDREGSRNDNRTWKYAKLRQAVS
jgi:hypothetical protein